MTDILTTAEAAKLMKVSTRMVQMLASDGTLPAGRVGRRWRFRREAVEGFTRSGKKSLVYTC